jgi:hypothetical protein
MRFCEVNLRFAIRICELEEEIVAQKRFMAELETRDQGLKAGAPATGHF